MEPVSGLLVFRILLGKSWPKLSCPALTGSFLLALGLVDLFVCVQLLCACQTLCQALWAHSPGLGGFYIGLLEGHGLWGHLGRALTQPGPALCRKEPRRAIGASPHLGG